MWKLLWGKFPKLPSENICEVLRCFQFFFLALLSPVPCTDLLKKIQPSTLVWSTLSTPDTNGQWGHVLKDYIFAFKTYLKLWRSHSPSCPISPWSFNCCWLLHPLLNTGTHLEKPCRCFLQSPAWISSAVRAVNRIRPQVIVTGLGFIITTNLNAFPEGCSLSCTMQPKSARVHLVANNSKAAHEQCFVIHISCQHGQDLKSLGSFFCLVVCCLLTCGWICCYWTQRDFREAELECGRVTR